MNRLANVEWRSDQPVAELIGEDGSRIAVSPAQFERIFGELARRVPTKARQITPGWQEHQLFPVQTFQAGLTLTKDGEKVALILDSGLPTEMTYCFDAQLCGQLAELLQEMHHQATGKPGSH